MSSATLCPYCRMPFDVEDAPAKIYCTACGVPHHQDCYEENGGCTVFGCPRAPADDPKLQVSHSDLNAAAVARPAGPAQGAVAPVLQAHYGGLQPGVAVAPGAAYLQPAYALGHTPKNRTTFIVLGVFLGALGIHNFYAGYVGRAVGQLCLTVLTMGFLSIVSWIWAIVEICVVEKDSAGIQFV